MANERDNKCIGHSIQYSNECYRLNYWGDVDILGQGVYSFKLNEEEKIHCIWQ